MSFFYHQNSGSDEIKVENETFKHLKARRLRVGDQVFFKNLEDEYLYSYQIIELNRKNAFLSLVSKEKKQKKQSNFHLGWCVVDPKTIERTLPILNQLGVYKITFIYCDYSQKNFKISQDRLQKILISSCEQCERDNLMRIEFAKNLDEFLKNNNNAVVLDFHANSNFQEIKDSNTFIIGPEGGFSQKERECFKSNKIIKLNTDLILKSETATICIASKICI